MQTARSTIIFLEPTLSVLQMIKLFDTAKKLSSFATPFIEEQIKNHLLKTTPYLTPCKVKSIQVFILILRFNPIVKNQRTRGINVDKIKDCL